MSLRAKVIRLAQEKPELREHLLPLLAKEAKLNPDDYTREQRDQARDAVYREMFGMNFYPWEGMSPAQKKQWNRRYEKNLKAMKPIT